VSGTKRPCPECEWDQWLQAKDAWLCSNPDCRREDAAQPLPLAEALRQAKAEAWEEGFRRGREMYDRSRLDSPNPYSAADSPASESPGKPTRKEVVEALRNLATCGYDDFGGSYVNLQVDEADVKAARAILAREGE
jgi:hypothetical protein